MAFRPASETGAGVDMPQGAGGDEAAAPVFCEPGGFFEAYIIIVRAGDDDGWEGQGIQRHGCEAGGPGGVGGRFGITGRHEKGSFDLPVIAFGPVCDSTARQAMTDEDDTGGRKGSDDLIDGVDPVVFIGRVPIALIYPCIAI